ncbi:hypothetical protein NDU88_001645 [Pleurodeles waltl]|uniref:KRAB domain-containing protein n=1 Tax=Pleurodeles waltl TaxID=8319 RepID=A0AAV7SDA7_PLEWA|nr:hypothetical protein NDU88_001645 [Pleurodeles waltl]
MLVTAAVEHCAPLLEASSLQEPLGDMSGQQPEEVVFCNASAYFSAEEWKRFDEWQKALYRNVMKEIHHALLLLVSPNLSTRVCLKKEEEPISIFIDHLGEKVGQTSKSLDIETFAISEINSQSNTEVKVPLGAPCSRSPSILSSQLLALTQSLYAEDSSICPPNSAETYRPLYKDAVGTHTEPRTLSAPAAPRLGTVNQ